MSDAKKCDRCGAFYEPGGSNLHIVRTVPLDTYDLCDNCEKALSNWLKTNEPEEAADEPEQTEE